MPEKRLFITEGRNAAGELVDLSYYEGHGAEDVSDDVKERSGAVKVDRKNMTRNPNEFYRSLKNAEETREVTPARGKRYGQRWTVGGLKGASIVEETPTEADPQTTLVEPTQETAIQAMAVAAEPGDNDVPDINKDADPDAEVIYPSDNYYDGPAERRFTQDDEDRYFDDDVDEERYIARDYL